MSSMLTHNARKLMIRSAKVFPFAMCLIVCLSYVEGVFSLLTCNYGVTGNSIVLYKPISWFIGDIFMYDWGIVVIAIVLSVAVETCVWNKISILYLCVNLYERTYFIEIELYKEWILVISIVNIAASGYCVHKGFKRLKSF